MKRALALIIVLLSVTFTYSQSADDVYYNPAAQVSPLKSFTYKATGQESIAENAAAIHNVQYCMSQYHRQRRTAYSMYIIGALLPIGGAIGGGDLEEPGLIAGGIFSIAGTICIIDADKWLKRASIAPSRNGASFIFQF